MNNLQNLTNKNVEIRFVYTIYNSTKQVNQSKTRNKICKHKFSYS